MYTVARKVLCPLSYEYTISSVTKCGKDTVQGERLWSRLVQKILRGFYQLTRLLTVPYSIHGHYLCFLIPCWWLVTV
jgi:hypothetical protein